MAGISDNILPGLIKLIRIILGKVGFGNQLFIYSASRVLANSGKKIHLVSFLDSHDTLASLPGIEWSNIKWVKLRKYSLINTYFALYARFPKQKKTLEKIFHIQSSESLEPNSSFGLKRYTKIIEGYFQDLRWIEAESKKLREILSNVSNSRNIQEYLPANGQRILGIHVRRGDYLQLRDTFGVLSLEYYKACLSKVDNKDFDNVIVFSDDIDWCREAFDFLEEPQFIGVQEIESTIETHLLLGMCETLICANSTFSISAATIFQVQSVFVPKQFYAESSIKESITSSYRDDWHVIDSVFDY